MVEENVSQTFRLKNIEETRNYFIKEIDRNDLVSKKHKTVCTTLNYIEPFLSFCSYCLCLNFCFGFFTSYSYRNYKLCNRIKNLCYNCRN